MKKIIGILRPFDFIQKIFVYEDGNKIDAAFPSIPDFSKNILALADTYSLEQVDLSGPKQFTKGIKKNIEQDELAKYAKNKLQINLI